MRQFGFSAPGAVLVLPFLVLLQACSEDVGQSRFFDLQFYHYEAVRQAGNAVYGGADIGEIQAILGKIPAGDEQAWYRAWNGMGERLEARAESLNDPTSKGLAFMRAQNYYRAAEFLLPPTDEKRLAVYRRSVDMFWQGLNWLGIEYERIDVPYEGGSLPAIYYPGPVGANERPLIVAMSGFDGTQEELYFKLVAGALRRGYAVLTFEGPGQGAPIRLHDLKFTHEWEIPTGAVLDAFLAAHPEPGNIVLLGASLGGYLAPRAAAFDPRIDAVVAYGVMYDVFEVGQAMIPRMVRPLAQWAAENENEGLLSTLVEFRARLDPSYRWAVNNALWTFGDDGLVELLRRQRLYTLEGVASNITADVLILHGAQDHMIPEQQLVDLQAALTNARSVTTLIYGAETGGHEHCQQGATLLWHEGFFDWLAEKFPHERDSSVATKYSLRATTTQEVVLE